MSFGSNTDKSAGLMSTSMEKKEVFAALVGLLVLDLESMMSIVAMVGKAAVAVS